MRAGMAKHDGFDYGSTYVSVNSNAARLGNMQHILVAAATQVNKDNLIL